MSWGEAAQVITAGAAVGALVMSWWNNREIKIIHKATNSMKDELVAEVRKSEHARGMRDERANAVKR